MTTSTLSTPHTTGQNASTEAADNKPQDLSKRSGAFAQSARNFVRRIPKTIASMGDCRRLVRCSGDIGATYLDADKAQSKSEFVQSMRTCCRQARQAKHWLHLLDVNLDEHAKRLHSNLLQEADELEKIFNAICYKVGKK